MTIQLSKDVESSINAAVKSGQFASADEMITTLVREYSQRGQHSPIASQATPTPTPSQKPIWERIQDLTADVPDEEWDKLPTDLAEQHDHYLYGTPKRPTK
jgi:Arc/MetJ-type ribon-helix-helix transcriptional regulator